jgi:arylsulfatase
MPLSDNLIANVGARIPRTYPVGSSVVLHPDGSAVHEECLPFMVFGFRIDVEVDVPEAGADGVLVALGDWNRGYGLYVVDGELCFTMVVTTEPVTVKATSGFGSGRRTLSVEYLAGGEGPSTLTLMCDGESIGSIATEAPIPWVWYVQSGAMLRVGRDVGFPVSDAYQNPFPWQGSIERVTITTPEPGHGAEGAKDFSGMASPELRNALEAD